MQKIGRLELTWTGKYEERELEPRILVEDKTKSYGDPKSKNILIHGDNLLALRSLESDYTGSVKCVYIDPPFNTKQAFEFYDDDVEHSIWLDLMARRLRILYNLLDENDVSDNGKVDYYYSDRHIESKEELEHIKKLHERLEVMRKI